MLITDNPEAFRFLIENGADPNSADRNDFSLLHSAVYVRELDLVKLLVEKGANIFALANYSKYPIYYAEGDIYDYLFEEMNKQGSKAQLNKMESMDSANELTSQNYKEICQLFDFNQQSLQDQNIYILHSLVADDLFEFFKELIEKHKWNPEALDMDNNTPLHISVQYNRYDFSQYLIERCHADINFINLYLKYY